MHTFMFVPANEDQKAERNSACSPDLFPGIDSIKISFVVFFFFPNNSSAFSAQNINYRIIVQSFS